MYGIVNKAIKELFVKNNGDDAWSELAATNNFPNHFLSNDNHSDDLTFNMVKACCEFESREITEFLAALGEYWILHTSQKYYSKLIPNSNLKKFIQDLPSFHSRVMLIYNDISPPEFEVFEIDKNTIQIDYYSSRLGLDYFMLGLLKGLIIHFNELCDVQLIKIKTSIKEPSSYTLRFENY